MTDKDADNVELKPRQISPTVVIVLVVVALFAGVLLAKSRSSSSDEQPVLPATTSQEASSQPGAQTITSTHNDATADYNAALKTGKPVYLLFHSMTCDPCVEISGVVDKVLPEYAGKVVFVNAISDDASGRQLASQFQFQYIPTSFFITPDGAVAESFTGAMTDADMKARLDKLIAQ